MTAYASAFVQKDGSSNGVTPKGARLALGGLIAHDGSAALAAHPGVMADGLGAVVSGTATTGTMTYSIRAAVFATLLGGTAAGGVAYGALDAATTVTTTAAPGSGSRTDRIWVRQHAVSPEGSDSDTILEFGCAAGIAIPTGAMEIATANMVAGTTHTDALTITQTHGWVVANGSPIPVRSQTERDALTGFDGLSVYRLDTHQVERHNGTAWNGAHFARRLLTRLTTFGLATSSLAAVGGWTTLTGDDGDGNLTLSTNTITAAKAGLYVIKGQFQFPNAASGQAFVLFYKNATVTSGVVTAGTIVGRGLQPLNSSTSQVLIASCEVVLAAGDTITFAIQQTSGGSLTVGSTSDAACTWSMRRADVS